MGLTLTGFFDNRSIEIAASSVERLHVGLGVSGHQEQEDPRLGEAHVVHPHLRRRSAKPTTTSQYSTGRLRRTTAPAKNAKDRLAYAWYISGRDAEVCVCGVLIAAQTVMSKTVLPNVEAVVVHTDEIPGVERFERLHIRMIRVKATATKGTYGSYDASFVKLRVVRSSALWDPKGRGNSYM